MAETDIKLNATEEPVINNNKTVEEGAENGTIIKTPEEELPLCEEKKDKIEEEKCEEKIIESKDKDIQEEIDSSKDNEKIEEPKIESKSEDIEKEQSEEKKVEVVIPEVVKENQIDETKLEVRETKVKSEKDSITSTELKKSVEEVIKDEKSETDNKDEIINSKVIDSQEPQLTTEKPKGRGRKPGQGAPKIKEPIATENGESIANSRPRRSTVKNVDYTGADTAAIWSALTPKGIGKRKNSSAKLASSTKKGRGRKRKTSSEGEDEMSDELSESEVVDKTPTKKVGRGKGVTKKTKTSDEDDEDYNEVVPTSKKRGAPKERAAVDKNEPKKRGRPSKGTSVNGDGTKEIDAKEEEKDSGSVNENTESDEQKMDTSTNCEKTAVETN